jgi:hypothetical protein
MRRPGRLSGPVVLLAIVAAGYAFGHHLVLPLLSGFGVLGAVLDALITLVVIVAASAVAVDLVRKHHRSVARLAGHHGMRAARYSGRAARAGGGRLADRLAAAPGVGRWLAAQAAGAGAAAVPDDAGATSGASSAAPRVCAACGNPEYGPRRSGGDWGPLVTSRDGSDTHLIHKAHFDDPKSGFHGRPYEELPPNTSNNQGGKMADPAHDPTNVWDPRNRSFMGWNILHRPAGARPGNASRISPQHRAQRAAAMSGSQVPGEWGAVVASAADLQPESDAHLIDWMSQQAAGMAAYAEAVVEAFETGTGAVGIDPKALTVLHDFADASAQAAETMMAAKQRFTEHYELPREFAANGGLMTHDGRWVTGDGA